MTDLVVSLLLPNPLGKDRPPLGPPSNQRLNQEWIEISNQAGRSLDLSGVRVLHTTFSRSCQKLGTESLTTFNGTLGSGHSIRLHSGTGEAWVEGTVHHLYAHRTNFAWNNQCGDRAELRTDTGGLIDWAAYDPGPPEGTILVRVPGTNRLVASQYRQTA